jgi:hypothetical protein
MYVCSHKTKRFIVAIKYEEEETYRYLIASDLSWRTLDIVQGHTLRWLVEVFIQDWKSYEGWSQLTKQPGDEGARHSVILSLLIDHSLFLHPDQQRQLKNNLPAYTVGSLRANVQVECLVEVIDDLVSSGDPQEKLGSEYEWNRKLGETPLLIQRLRVAQRTQFPSSHGL